LLRVPATICGARPRSQLRLRADNSSRSFIRCDFPKLIICFRVFECLMPRVAEDDARRSSHTGITGARRRSSEKCFFAKTVAADYADSARKSAIKARTATRVKPGFDHPTRGAALTFIFYFVSKVGQAGSGVVSGRPRTTGRDQGRRAVSIRRRRLDAVDVQPRRSSSSTPVPCSGWRAL